VQFGVRGDRLAKKGIGTRQRSAGFADGLLGGDDAGAGLIQQLLDAINRDANVIQAGHATSVDGVRWQRCTTDDVVGLEFWAEGRLADCAGGRARGSAMGRWI
jgi:hypothetical protein